MRLIDADALIAQIEKRLCHAKTIVWLCRIIGEVPTIEAEPVRHGRWVPLSYDGYADGYPVYDEWECSECHFSCNGEGEPQINY